MPETAATTITVKGQVTIPKPIRDALNLTPGSAVRFRINDAGQVVIEAADASAPTPATADRFDAARGRAEVKWRTDDLMRLLRADDVITP